MKLVSIVQNAQQTGVSVWRETNEALMRIFSGSLNTAAAGCAHCAARGQRHTSAIAAAAGNTVRIEKKQKIVKRNSFAKMILLPLYYTRLIGKL